MTISGFLPQRWRATPETARHAEAIAGILHTAPIEQTPGPVIATLLGTAEVLPCLVAVKSLHRQLRRGSIALVDDGTLTGEDRAILAHHLGDPEIVPHAAVQRGPFPAGAAWALLLAILDRRAGEYWVAVDPHTVTLAELPEVGAAIASNRSFALTGGAQAIGGPTRALERRVSALCGTRGWRYRTGCGGLTGFAAGGTGRSLASAFLAELKALGESATAGFAHNLVFANEAEPVLLPRERYGRHRAAAVARGAAFLHFPNGPRDGEPFTEASCSVVAKLLI